MQIQTVNPATEAVIETYSTMPPDEIRDITRRCRRAFEDWRARSVGERAALLIPLAKALRERRDEHARLITLEMGKTIAESRAEVEKCAWLCEVYAERGEGWLAEEIVEADGLAHKVVFEPLGVVLSIMPWNFPFWQALRFAVPTLLAGNTSLLKHASNVPRCARAIAAAFAEAGFPADVFRTIFADHAAVGELLAGDIVRGVSLTGSTEAGARVAEAAGRHLKKVVLELGGSDPFIVLEDADLDLTLRGAVAGRMVCTGQSCIAAKRFLVVEALAERFAEGFAARMRDLVVGDPLDEGTQVGPIASEAGLLELQSQVEEALAGGARLLAGGRRLDRRGYFLEPTVLGGVQPSMRVAREEVFGPVAPVIAVKDEDEALRIANASEFGLGGSVWTRDLARGEALARRVDSGSLFVNSIVKSDPRMPFGGVKRSGLGRELSHYGLREFVNVKGLSIYAHE
jgi:succinate-semialdehyde dehydrogenase/glutarate-semialdehyde dehydrogenase